MTTLLILGGYGYTGKLLARHLLAQSKVQIILAGRNPDKAWKFANELNDKRVSTAHVDAADADSLRAALQNVDLLLVAAPTTQHTETVIRAALDAKVDYLDVQYSHKKLIILNGLALGIERAGLCFVTEAATIPACLRPWCGMQLNNLTVPKARSLPGT